jgi:hypothetical protein
LRVHRGGGWGWGGAAAAARGAGCMWAQQPRAPPKGACKAAPPEGARSAAPPAPHLTLGCARAPLRPPGSVRAYFKGNGTNALKVRASKGSRATEAGGHFALEQQPRIAAPAWAGVMPQPQQPGLTPHPLPSTLALEPVPTPLRLPAPRRPLPFPPFQIAPETSIKLTLNDWLKHHMGKDHREISPWERVLCGGVSGAVGQVRTAASRRLQAPAPLAACASGRAGATCTARLGRLPRAAAAGGTASQGGCAPGTTDGGHYRR